MRKELAEKFDKEFINLMKIVIKVGEERHRDIDVKEEVKSFIDEHFVEKEEHNKMFASMAHPVPCDEKGNPLYTKEQVLELIGEDVKHVCGCEDMDYCDGVELKVKAINQAKQEIRDRL